MKGKSLSVELDTDGLWLVRRAILRATEVMKDGEDIKRLCELDAQIGREVDCREKQEKEKEIAEEVPKRIEEMADKLDDAVRLLRGIKGSFKMLFATPSLRPYIHPSFNTANRDTRIISSRL